MAFVDMRNFVNMLPEDKKAGVLTDELYCEACEAVEKAKDYLGKEKIPKPDRKTADKNQIKEAKAYNEEVEIAQFIRLELDRFKTDFGVKFREFCEYFTSFGKENFANHADEILSAALSLPQGATKEERVNRSDAIKNARAVKKAAGYIKKYYPDGLNEFSPADFEAAFDLPEETKEQRELKRAAVKKAKAERNAYGKVMKPYLFAERIVTLAEGYDGIDSFTADYAEAAARLNQKRENERAEEESKAARRKAEAQEIALRKKK